MLSPCSFSSGPAVASPATPGPCRPAEKALPSHPAPHQNKHGHCQRATGACNEKQVSPRDLSAVAVQQLGVTAVRAGEGWGHCRTPPPECSAPRAHHGAQQPPHALVPGDGDCQVCPLPNQRSQGTLVPARRALRDKVLALVPSALSQCQLHSGSESAGVLIIWPESPLSFFQTV